MNRRQIERVRRQSIKSIRGYRDHTPAREKTRRVSQQFPFGVDGIDAQQFSRQFFGLWRSRTATCSAASFPSSEGSGRRVRSAPFALPVFGRRYHTPSGRRNTRALLAVIFAKLGVAADELADLSGFGMPSVVLFVLDRFSVFQIKEPRCCFA